MVNCSPFIASLVTQRDILWDLLTAQPHFELCKIRGKSSLFSPCWQHISNAFPFRIMFLSAEQLRSSPRPGQTYPLSVIPVAEQDPPFLKIIYFSNSPYFFTKRYAPIYLLEIKKFDPGVYFWLSGHQNRGESWPPTFMIIKTWWFVHLLRSLFWNIF